MRKKIAMGLIGLTALSAATAGVYAFGGMGKGNHLFENNADIKDAIDNNDYESFISALSEIDSDVAQRISEERFEHMVQRIDEREKVQAAIEAEDYDAFISAINENRAEGMTLEKFNEIVERHNTHEAIEDAIENNDYEAWIEAVSSLPHAPDIADVITEEDFSTLIELHEAKQSGNFEEAKELAEELGLQRGQMRGMMHDRGFKKGFGDMNKEGHGGRGNRGLMMRQ